MRKIIATYLVLAFLSFVCAKQLMAETYFKAIFLTPERALEKWGRRPFNSEEFKNSSSTKRGAMAVDIILTKHFLGKSILADVRRELGTPDNYFFSDTIIAYEIEPPNKNEEESWELVFIPDKTLKFVKEVKIHKRCCYSQPSWAK